MGGDLKLVAVVFEQDLCGLKSHHNFISVPKCKDLFWWYIFRHGYIDADLPALQPGRYIAVLYDGSDT